MTKKKDNIYATKLNSVRDFSFDQTVVEVFDDMLHRSIPGYDAVLHQIGAFATQYARPDTHLYDLGCSLGAATFAIRKCVDHRGCQIIAVDLSRDMITRFEQRLARSVGVLPVSVHCADIADLPMEKASFVVMNFTLQFIDTPRKAGIIQKIYDAMVPGGALVLSEKIVFESLLEQEYLEDAYYRLKRHNGYNDLEISQKRDALENVLKLESAQTHLARLQAAGFSTSFMWYQNLNFASFIAVK